jgi:hypothetical protein
VTVEMKAVDSDNFHDHEYAYGSTTCTATQTGPGEGYAIPYSFVVHPQSGDELKLTVHGKCLVSYAG